MASNSAEVDTDVTISDMSSSNVPVDEIPPPILEEQEEEVAMEQWNKEIEVPKKNYIKTHIPTSSLNHIHFEIQLYLIKPPFNRVCHTSRKQHH
jgi:hypothetical protein